MKKAYVKPKITVEDFQLDAPIAANCEANFDDVRSIMEFGYWFEREACSTDMDAVEWGNDTVCYHSNIQTAFLS